MIRVFCLCALLGLAVCRASADEYWIAYEGNDFPENEGWTRIVRNGTAIRFIDRGHLVIDSRANRAIADFYRRSLAGTLDPQPGEVFVAQWGLQVEEVNGFSDPIVEIRSDDSWSVLFEYNIDRIFSFFEPGVSIPFSAGAPHDYELRSADMRAYELFVDGTLVRSGEFMLGLAASQVSWGDGVQGASSLTRWDYFRFGVVPEPGSGLLLALALTSRRVSR